MQGLFRRDSEPIAMGQISRTVSWNHLFTCSGVSRRAIYVQVQYGTYTNQRQYVSGGFLETVKLLTAAPSRGLQVHLHAVAQKGARPRRELCLTITGSLAVE